MTFMTADHKMNPFHIALADVPFNVMQLALVLDSF